MTAARPRDYMVDRVYLVGSAVSGKKTSDVDIFLETPYLTKKVANRMKVTLAMMYFTDRPKQEAIDPYVGKMHKDKPYLDLSDISKKLIQKYNKKL